MKNYTESEIYSLIERFEYGELPRIEWTHEAHLVVAIWYSRKYEAEQALNLVRTFITAHNESVGTPNTDTEGYHETITHFWLQVARGFIEKHPSTNIEEQCNAFINAEVAQSNYPLTYYSEALLFSVSARHNWVDPDLRSIK